jgi:hypothetical protein
MEKENLLFLYFVVSEDLQDHKKLGDFYNVNILSQEAARALELHERSHEAQTGMGGPTHFPSHATRTRLALEHRLGSIFICTPPSRKKTYTIFCLDFFEAEANPSSTSGRADPAVLLLPPVGNCCHHRYRLLLNMG